MGFLNRLRDNPTLKAIVHVLIVVAAGVTAWTTTHDVTATLAAMGVTAGAGALPSSVSAGAKK